MVNERLRDEVIASAIHFDGSTRDRSWITNIKE
jgi:hypothetical protein